MSVGLGMGRGWANAAVCIAVVQFAAAGCTRASGNEARRAERDPEREAISARALARLAPGTLVEVRLEDSISLRHNHAGEAVRATVTEDVSSPHGGIVIPSGSRVKLRITALEPQQVVLWVTELTMRGKQYVVHGRVDSPPATVRRQSAKPDVVVLRGTRVVFPLDRALTVATR